ncbi:MAG: PilZ domain-containing protein [Desulforhopalus sp.]
MKSKRAAFRFPCQHQRVRFKTAYEDGEASLLNISTDGCALQSPSVPLTINEKILITIIPEGQEESFEARSRIVRVDNDVLGLQFTVLELSTKTQIRNYFSRKFRES